MKFIGYDMLVERFGEPDPQNHHMVYDGEIEIDKLERIYEKFDGEQEVPSYAGHSFSVPDVVELHNEEVSKFYYVDYRDFRQATFGGPKPVQPLVLQP